MSLGNSLMAAGHALDGAKEPGHAASPSILAWSVLQSNGRLWMTAPPGEDAAAATSNLSAQQIVDIHLPKVVAQKPAIVLVGPLFTNGGPNRPALVKVVNDIRAYGGTPVLLTEFPSGGGSTDTNKSRDYVARENVWIKRFAADRGIPVVDAYAVLVDPATDGKFKAAYSNDGLHQNGAGARAVARAVVDVLDSLLDATPGVALAQAQETGIFLNANPLNLNGASGSALPSGWTQTNGAGASDSDDPAVFGNWLKITSTSGSYNVGSTFPLPIGEGDRMYLSFRMRADVADGGVAKINLRSGGTVIAGASITEDLEDGVFAAEWTHTNHGQNQILIQAFNAGTSVHVSQLTLINLTAQQVLSP